jgi:hypothetical protein
MIHLIGINHKFGRYNSISDGNGFSPDHILYKNAVELAIRELKPDLFAEEDNLAYFKDGDFSILQVLGVHYGFKPLFIDPDFKQREKINYKNEKALKKCWEDTHLDTFDKVQGKAHEIVHQFPVRERFWLRQLGTTNKNDILLVCGDLHIETFPILLKTLGIPYTGGCPARS